MGKKFAEKVKTFVMSEHNETKEQVVARYIRGAMIYGGMTQKEIQKIVDITIEKTKKEILNQIEKDIDYRKRLLK